MSNLEAIRLALELDQRTAERDRALSELESFRARDTEPPPESQTGKSWTLLEAMSTIVEAKAAIETMSTAAGTAERMALQAYKAVIEEMPAIIKAAVADAVIELATRQQQTAAKVEDIDLWRRRRDRACEDCPNLEAAGV